MSTPREPSAWQSRASTIAMSSPAPVSQDLKQDGPSKNAAEQSPPEATLELISECFKEATRRWDTSVTEKSKSSWNSPLLCLGADVGYPTVTPQHLLEAACNTHRSYVVKSEKGIMGKTALLYKGIISNLDRHAKAIDVFVQRDPLISLVVWGSVRVYLEIAIDNSRASELIATGILLIIRHVDRWYLAAELFGNDPRIKEALTSLYYSMIGFLMPAIQRLNQGSCTRFASSIFHKESGKASLRLTEMREAEKELETELTLNGYKIYQETLQTATKSLEVARGIDSQLRTRNRSCPARIEGEANGQSWLRLDAALSRLDGISSLKVIEANQFEGTCENVDDIHRWIRQFRSSSFGLRKTNNFSLRSPTLNELWLLQHEGFKRWMNIEPSNLLWIVGDTGETALLARYSQPLTVRLQMLIIMAGSGKSDTATRLFDANKSQNPNHRILFHAFHANMSAEERSSVNLAASLLDQQLLECSCVSNGQKNAFRALKGLFIQYRTSLRDCPFDRLWEVCEGLLGSEGEFSIIIDAMDECSFTSRQEAQDLLKKLEKASFIASGKIVILSRPTLALGLDPSSKVLCSQLRITPEDTAGELNAFCDRLSKQLELDQESQQLAAERAKANAQGSFLWVRLYFQDLNSFHYEKDIKERLRDGVLPQTCKEFYQRAWNRQNHKLRLNDQKACREIYSLLLSARRQLALREMSEATGLRFSRLQHIIAHWCQPFISVLDDYPYLTHASVKEFLQNESNEKSGPCFKMEESNGVLARKCLDFLLKDAYANPDAIGKRMRSNLGLDASSGEPDRSSFYDHAAQYWDTYLTALDSPETSLLDLAAKFIHSAQFSFWAEYSYRDAGDFQAIRATYIRLGDWEKKLSAGQRDRLDLPSYYSKAYKDLHSTYKSGGTDVTLPWLPLMQLGMFYFDIGRINEMAAVRALVSDGLSSALGKRHPLTLRARSDAAYAPLIKGDVRVAYGMYLEVAKDQREVMPREESSALYFTLIYQGQAELLLNQFDKALDTLSSASAGFLNIGGPETNGYLAAQLWFAIVNGFSGNIQQAVKTMELVCEKREQLYGPDDGFATTTRIFAGDMYRLQGREEESIRNIRIGLDLRRRLWQSSHQGVIDPSIRLVIALRDFGQEVEAFDIIDDLEDNIDLGKEDRFYELCQVTHLKALLLFDGGETDKPIETLQSILIEAGDERNNRPLLWVRLDLADILRYRNQKGDEKAARILFDGILVQKALSRPRKKLESENGEPDPPSRLEIAEAALRLFRKEGLGEADALLRGKSLTWASQESLWLPLGMPAADTTRMKPPQGIGRKRKGE